MPTGRVRAGSASTPSSCSAVCCAWAHGARLFSAACKRCGAKAPCLVIGWFRLFAARDCFVRVTFSNHAPLELHGGGELARILGPLFGHRAESLQSLKVGQRAIHPADDVA